MMNYDQIIHPETYKKFSIFSKEGKSLLKNYVKQFKSGGGGGFDLLKKAFVTASNLTNNAINTLIPNSLQQSNNNELNNPIQQQVNYNDDNEESSLQYGQGQELGQGQGLVQGLGQVGGSCPNCGFTLQ